ncbi:MAG TPA: ribosome maturation factor RimP [Chryseosolibacter sp.]
MDLNAEIRQLVEPHLAPDQFLVDVVVTAKKGPGKVLVLLDGDNGINIDTCAEISRQLSKSLDERNLIGDNYLLEVSTPGVDQPLKLKRQYHKHVGRSLKVKLLDGTQVEGKLAEVKEDEIVLNQEIGSGKKKETKTIDVPFAAVDKTFVLVSFK